MSAWRVTPGKCWRRISASRCRSPACSIFETQKVSQPGWSRFRNTEPDAATVGFGRFARGRDQQVEIVRQKSGAELRVLMGGLATIRRSRLWHCGEGRRSSEPKIHPRFPVGAWPNGESFVKGACENATPTALGFLLSAAGTRRPYKPWAWASFWSSAWKAITSDCEGR